MDRRQQKTRQAIFHAFSKLLETRRFENITVQEIIDAANIGRSTFYAHFETKDALLREMCTDIFRHVFEEHLTQEADHDYSTGEQRLLQRLEHILYHLRENQRNLTRLLCTESGELFMNFFKEYLYDMFTRYLDEFQGDVPRDYLLYYLVGGFAETVRWWVSKDMQPSPEEIAGYFMAVNETHNTREALPA